LQHVIVFTLIKNRPKLNKFQRIWGHSNKKNLQNIFVFTLTKHRPKFGRISAYLRALEQEKKIYLFITRLLKVATISWVEGTGPFGKLCTVAQKS
jgi:hypothetical protein